MRIPVIRGVIERRILVNYRVDPGVLAGHLPAPFRPRVVHGVGMVGICLIRLASVRPRFVPSWLGIRSENAAHRAAVEWDDGGARSGVYVRRRDTDSWLNSLAGGRMFQGVHHHGRFAVRETPNSFDIALHSDDGETDMAIRARSARRLPATSAFGSLEEASDFFQAGSLGYSATADPRRFEGLELRCRAWRVEPLEIEEARSSFFDDRALFPQGSIELDCALLMRDVAHEWHGQSDLCCAANAAA